MSNSKRALRRHHRDRLNKRAEFIISKVWYWFNPWNQNDLQHFVNKRRDNMKGCSCWMCGNPRNNWKERLTLQELKHLDSEKDQLDDLYLD